ncbi:hypothetical protein RHMOL_Rhmol04G0061300 [Rhododendron molle]|uniref:Uncharacterized protein n=1 Tax=Rhododendron molle TaxID=49168 RepID=A0ACC0NXS8_RHOML|nr:hypothetical protein RHMOL_Rhmol04G0061300 [Rhododendron molle]
MASPTVTFDINKQSNRYAFTHVKTEMALTPHTLMPILTSTSPHANFHCKFKN